MQRFYFYESPGPGFGRHRPPMEIVHGVLLAFLAANIYGLLGIAFELAAKRDYPNWDFTFYKQSFGTLLGLGFTLWLGLPLYMPKVLMMAFGGAVCYL